MADTRDITKDMWYCAQKAFIPENLKKKIDRIKSQKEQSRLRKKVENGSQAAISVMQSFVTGRTKGFCSIWPMDLKYCECAILEFLQRPYFSNYTEIRYDAVRELKEYSDLQSNSLTCFVNEEILKRAFEIVQGDNVTHVLKCNIEEHTYEIIKCSVDVDKQQNMKIEGEKAQILNGEIDEVLLTLPHMVLRNPVLNESCELKKQYLDNLIKYIQLGGWEKRKYVQAQIKVYSRFLQLPGMKNIRRRSNKNIEKYRYFLLLDLLHILGYDHKIVCSNTLYRVVEVYISDFPVLKTERDVIKLILDAVVGNYGNWERIKRHSLLTKEKEYMETVERNLRFCSTAAFRILVTATMSAGKSTFINCLLGKNISLSQNMACTSKIHTILGKAMEDGFTYIYDHELELMAGEEELFHNNKQNSTDYIMVGTHYNGSLGGERIIISDSPGVNFCGEEEHKRITNKMITEKNYDLLIYLINATQLGTNDDLEHLRYVKRHVEDIPVLFVINKIDAFDTEEEDLIKIMQNVIKYIQSVWGSEIPIVCPVSARAGYLAKISQYENLSKVENGELNGYIDKFTQMSVREYYQQYYPTVIIEDSWQKKNQLLKNCGISYVEKIIKKFYEGGRKNGTSLCQV